MRFRIAVYARDSSDRQSPESIQDQIRKCREYANKQGWEFQDEPVYSDEALSGAGADRPALVKLLATADRKPLPFDVLLFDDTSRLSRNIGDIARAFETLKFAGIRFVAVSQGIDSHNEQADVLMTVHSLVDSLVHQGTCQKDSPGPRRKGAEGALHRRALQRVRHRP